MVEEPGTRPQNGTEDGSEDGSVQRARRLGRRVAHGLILGLSVAFVASSGWQIVHALFWSPAPPTPRQVGSQAPGVTSSRTCPQTCAKEGER